MASVLDNALIERDNLKKRLAEVERFIRLYKEFQNQNVSRTPESTASDSQESPIQRNGGRRVPPAELAHIVSRILTAGARPFTRGELVEALEKVGMELPGKDKESKSRYVGTIMWRNAENFENVEGRGYWLKGEPVPSLEVARSRLRSDYLTELAVEIAREGRGEPAT